MFAARNSMLTAGATGAPPPPPPGTRFPLLGGYLIAPSTNYGNASYGSPLTKLDLVILSMWNGWVGAGGQTPTQAVNYIKTQNPNIIVGNYTLMTEVPTAAGGSQADVQTKLAAEHGPGGVGDWYAYDNTGAHVSSFSGTYATNPTLLVTPDASGYHFTEWLARRDNTLVIGEGPAFDIWFSDNQFVHTRIVADWNRDGANDPIGTTSASVSDAWYRAGEKAYYDTARALQPGKKIMANCDSDLGVGVYPAGYGTFTEFTNVVHGALMEGAMGLSWSAETWGGFATVMGWYHSIFTNLLPPKMVMLQTILATTTDYQGLRYSLAACLMDNGYYCVTAPGQANNAANWFDEFDLAGGSTTKWLGTAIDPPQTSPWSLGVYMRRFQNGLALCNPKGNGVRTVTPPSGYTHFSGTQAPTVNNGISTTTVTLQDRNSAPNPGGDGLLLVKLGTNGY